MEDVASRTNAGSANDMPDQIVVHGVSVNRDPRQAPHLVDDCDTLAQLFRARCLELGARVAHREKHLGIWHSYTWTDFWEHARLIGLSLLALGVKRGDAISILSENNKEWVYTDLAVQCIGCLSSGVYTTDSASQLAYLINDSDSRVLFVENDEQLDKFLAAREDMPGLYKVVVYDREGLHAFSDPQVIFYDDLLELGRQQLVREPQRFDDEISQTKAGDVAMLVYTSGTTGPPKGAMISNANLMAFAITGAHTFPTRPSDQQICFLPLCHIFERTTTGLNPIVARSTVNFAESPETVFENVQEVSPTIFNGVPRIWEKIFSRVTILLQDATPLQRWAFDRAVAAGMRCTEARLEGRQPAFLDRLSHQVWDILVLANLRRMLGLAGVRRAVSGAAPVSPELLRWYMSIGVNIIEGYAQTENTAAATANRPDRLKLGTVGQPAAGVQIRISPEGEIQTNGPTTFVGYLNKPDKTAEALTVDGWLRTGDVGFIDNEGFVSITGRIKDIIITSGGKNIAPAEIENRLKFSPYISDAVIIGDKRKYLTCLIMIDQENVEKYAQDLRVPFSDFRSLCAAREVQKLVQGIIDQVNREFARVEQIKDFRLIDVLLTAEDDELTATMKLKRSLVEERHGNLVDQMYAVSVT